MLEAGAVQRVEVHVEAAETGGEEVGGVLFQEDRVGGEGDVADAGNGGQLFDELVEVPANEGLAAGEADFGDAERDCGTDKTLNFLEAEDVGAVHELDAFLGHAVEAADVAAVGDADPQAVVQASEFVDERLHMGPFS